MFSIETLKRLLSPISRPLKFLRRRLEKRNYKMIKMILFIHRRFYLNEDIESNRPKNHRSCTHNQLNFHCYSNNATGGSGLVALFPFT